MNCKKSGPTKETQLFADLHYKTISLYIFYSSDNFGIWRILLCENYYDGIYKHVFKLRIFSQVDHTVRTLIVNSLC